jgi:hypothetical protein
MISFGKDNWIGYGWGSTFEDVWTKGSRLHVSLTYNIAEYYRPATAAIHAVRHIVDNYPAPYNLMCSGGIDSQTMIWAWIISGVPFNIVSIRYVSDGMCFNEHDLIELTQFTNLHNLKVDYREFDVISFLENDLSYVATTYECESPQFATHIKMTELVKTGTIMFSGNYFYHNVPMSLNVLSLQRYAQHTDTADRKTIPIFFMHTPEVGMSFSAFIDKLGPHPTRGNIYRAAGFPVIDQPKKLNGFERLKEYYDKYDNRIDRLTRFKYGNKPSKRAFDLLFRYPYEGYGLSKTYQGAKIIHKDNT